MCGIDKKDIKINGIVTTGDTQEIKENILNGNKTEIIHPNELKKNKRENKWWQNLF